MIYSFGNSTYDLWNVQKISRYSNRKGIIRKKYEYIIELEYRNGKSKEICWDTEEARDYHYNKLINAWKQTQKEKQAYYNSKRK